MDFAGVFVLLCVAGVRGGYKAAAADFGRRRGKMAEQRWTGSILLAVAVGQGMDMAAVAAAVVVEMAAGAVWTKQGPGMEDDHLREMSAGVE
jgi:hypothetical protein